MILLSTGSRIEELFSKFSIKLLLLTCVLRGAGDLFPGDLPFLEKVVVEDFEKNTYTAKNWVTARGRHPLDRVRITSLVTAPLAESGKSLFVGIPDLLDEAVTLPLIKKFPVEKYGEELVFHVRSSGFDGRFYVILENYAGEVKHYQVTTLNFTGWKEIRFPLKGLLNQNDVFFHAPSVFYIRGIAIEEGHHVPGQEKNLYLDDILLVQRSKFLLPKDLDKPF